MKKEIEVLGTQEIKVKVSPFNVLESLRIEAMGDAYNWIDVKKDKYFILKQ